MTIEVRSLAEAELQRFVDASVRGFGDDMLEGEFERVAKVIGADRCLAAFDDGRIIGTSASYRFPLAVPGGADIDTAGLTRVTVAATHRRQGVLTAMMDAHFTDAADHGEALSILWASEAAIYGRYGYGPATESHAVSFDSRLAGIVAPPQRDQMEIIEADEAAGIMPELREHHRIQRPGMYGRSEAWWTYRSLPDHKEMRDGKSARRYVVARRNGAAVGYVTFRHREGWSEAGLPTGEIHINEVCAIDHRAEHNLWWHVANIDLFPNVVSWNQPPDSPLPWLATNARAIIRRHSDGIYLRVLDVETALSTRRYASATDLIFEVADERLPDVGGVYQLTVNELGDGVCRRSDAEPELRLSTYALGALFLGSTRPEPLAQIGEITAPGVDGGAAHDNEMFDRVVARLRDIFGWPVTAWCSEMF